MDNINKDNLVKFISYFIIVFLLSIILYLMYIDFISETFNSISERFSDVNINNKLEYINLIENNSSDAIEHLSSSPDMRDNVDLLTPSIPYLLKKDILAENNQLTVLDAKCLNNDIINVDPVNNSNITCTINSNNLYLNSSGSNNFSIKVVPDGISSQSNDSKYTRFDYDVSLTDLNNKDISELRKTYFYFTDVKMPSKFENKPREFSYKSKYDIGILNYFNNHAKYKNYINSNTFNKLIIPPIIEPTPQNPTNNNFNLINTYFSYLQNLLLLSNSLVDSPFVYNSGYDFDINDIKFKLIKKYTTLLGSSSPIQFNMVINDNTNIKFFYDSLDIMNVYTFVLNPSVVITFNNLKLIFNTLPSNIVPGSIWSLYYVNEMIPMVTSDSTYSYTDMFEYPIALPLATPTTQDWKNNKVNGVMNYYQDIFKRKGLINIKIMDPASDSKLLTNKNGNDIVIKNLYDFIKILGNTQLLSITDIFVFYDPKTNDCESWVITSIIDDQTQEPIIVPLITFNLNYEPINCPPGMLYHNHKCLPSCPQGYNYDLGLVCLNSTSSKYLPNSDMCKYINSLSLPEPINPIIEGIKEGCDNNYFNKSKKISNNDIAKYRRTPS